MSTVVCVPYNRLSLCTCQPLVVVWALFVIYNVVILLVMRYRVKQLKLRLIATYTKTKVDQGMDINVVAPYQ